MATLVVFVVVLVGVVVLSRNYEVVEKGRLLPYSPSGEIRRIRVFDRFNVYAEPEVRPTADVFHSYILITISSVALLATAFFRLAAEPSQPRTRSFFVVTWLGAGYLAADELMGGHESIGHNLRFLRELPVIDRPDDGVLAIYMLAALVFLYVFRSVILASRGARACFAAAIIMAIVAAAADLLNVRGEEFLEPLASVSVLVGFVILTLRELVAARLAPANERTWT